MVFCVWSSRPEGKAVGFDEATCFSIRLTAQDPRDPLKSGRTELEASGLGWEFARETIGILNYVLGDTAGYFFAACLDARVPCLESDNSA